MKLIAHCPNCGSEFQPMNLWPDIIRAVNAHDDMLAALEGAKAMIDTFVNTPIAELQSQAICIADDKRREAIEAAIAKATGAAS